MSIQSASNPRLQRLSQTSTLSVVTEGGMTICSDGGQELERMFLTRNPNRVSHRTYTEAKSIVKTIKKELNLDTTKLQSAVAPQPFFIPCTALHSIISQETVDLLLQELYPNKKLGQMNKDVLVPSLPSARSFRRTIAILILIDKSAYLNWFFEKDISDKELPLDFSEMQDPRSIYAELAGFGWEPEDFRNFCRARAEVSPVFFSVSNSDEREKIVHYRCRSDEVLPFTQQHGLTAKGGFGKVSSYDLHEDQQNLHRHTVRVPISVKSADSSS